MLLDFVQEVQVKSSGYNAEFGGATGGVVSVLTKSGSNNVHGQAGTYFQSNDFYGARRPSVRFNPQNTAITEQGLEDSGRRLDLPQPARRHRRPDHEGQAVVLRRPRLHEEQLLA